MKNYSEQKLDKPLYYSTLNGICKVTHKMVTPIPIEFNVSGSFTWKVMDLTGRKYDGIIGQNFLTPLNAKLDLGYKFLEVNNRKTNFERNDHFLVINKVCNFEGSNIDKINLDHLNREEKVHILGILRKLF